MATYVKELVMRYFFDIISARRCELDSFGTSFCEQGEARKWAQLLTVVLQNASDKQELEGGHVRVRSPDGQELFSIPMCPAQEDLERASSGWGEQREEQMKSLVVKRSITVGGRRSSVSLEEAFWKGLKDIASSCRVTLAEVVSSIDSQRQHSNLSSAIRLFVLDHYRAKLGPALMTRAAAGIAMQPPRTGADGLRSTEEM
jgi:predicted DNA-binding ribbon-helix-helix protein